MNLAVVHKIFGSDLIPVSFFRVSSQGPARCSRGFTLIELVVVLVLVSMAAALIVPRLPATESMNLGSSARSLAATLRYLGERSVASKNSYRLHINISENSVKVTRRLASGDEIPPEDTLLIRSPLASGVVVTDFQSPRLGKVTEGDVMVDFGAAGLYELMTIHLSSAKGESYTITAYPRGGKVKILPGYQEVSL